MAKRREAGWRDRAASDLLRRHLPAPDPGADGLLLMEDPLPGTAASLESAGYRVTRWNRRALGGLTAAPWPPPGPFDLVALRLPRSREELAMALHGAASALAPGGRLLLYGAKDEGIRSGLAAMEELFSGTGTRGVGGHCRVLEGRWGEGGGRILGSLEEWRVVVDPGYPELGGEWVSYPGVFAHGRLDAGSRLLLDALPALPAGSRVLDYGCGSGPVGGVAAARGEAMHLELLDVDSVALEAARENVPGATLRLGDGLPDPGEGPYDAILSNPPFHRGKAEDSRMVLELIQGARRLLAPSGRLIFVTQRRLGMEEGMGEGFRAARILAEDSIYRVWEGEGPR